MTRTLRHVAAIAALMLAGAGLTALVVTSRASTIPRTPPPAPVTVVAAPAPPTTVDVPERGRAPRPRAAAGSPPLPHRSRAIGAPNRGRLVGGVALPPETPDLFTWTLATGESPSPGWRRVGTDTLVAWLQGVLRYFRATHPGAPRIGIGDLSLPQGGPFGPRYGGLGHASHQNGLDVDVLYPRRDRREQVATRPSQVDRALSQALVDTFVAAGARFCFVGRRVGLSGPPAVVQVIPHHDDHVHVRIPAVG